MSADGWLKSASQFAPTRRYLHSLLTQFPAEETVNFVSAIIDKIRAARQHARNKVTFKGRLMSAVSDGKLTPEEMTQLTGLQHDLGLTPDEVAAFRVSAFLVAFAAAKEAGGAISADGEHELSNIRTFLSIPNAEIGPSLRELDHYRLLRNIHDGDVPVISVPGLLTQKGESPYWREAGAILEEKVVDRQYVGGSQGVSVRIMKGVSYRVGAQRGHLVSTTGVVPVSNGELVITSKRLIFVGTAKGFNIRLDKVLNLELHSDGVTVTDGNSKPHVVRFADTSNTDVVGAILSYAVNHFAA
jgi:hypothetical protein